MRIRSTVDNYIVSDCGDVISPRGRKLSPYIGDRGGHLRVDLPGRRVFVHQLVAEAFIGPRPDGQEVRHLNGDPADNRVQNLAYGTRSQNVADAIRHGTYRNAIAEKNAEKTHCPRGHEYDDSNTYLAPSGRRFCRACKARWR